MFGHGFRPRAQRPQEAGDPLIQICGVIQGSLAGSEAARAVIRSGQLCKQRHRARRDTSLYVSGSLFAGKPSRHAGSPCKRVVVLPAWLDSEIEMLSPSAGNGIVITLVGGSFKHN